MVTYSDVNEIFDIPTQLPGSYQRLQRPSRRYAKRPTHARYRVVRRYISFLRGLHNLPSTRDGAHRKRETKHHLPIHHARLVCSDDLHARPVIGVGILPLSVFGWVR